MTTALIILLFVLDFVLLVLFLLGRKRQATIDDDLVREITEERRALADLRNAVREELTLAQSKAKGIVDRVAHLAAEAEQEVRNGGQTLATEAGLIVDQLAERLEAPLAELTKKQRSLSLQLQKVDKQRALLAKMLKRGEKLVKFFDDKVPYEEVLSELEDKKYEDAKQLLAKGIEPDVIAVELGMSASEVRLIAGIQASL